MALSHSVSQMSQTFIVFKLVGVNKEFKPKPAARARCEGWRCGFGIQD